MKDREQYFSSDPEKRKLQIEQFKKEISEYILKQREARTGKKTNSEEKKGQYFSDEPEEQKLQIEQFSKKIKEYRKDYMNEPADSASLFLQARQVEIDIRKEENKERMEEMEQESFEKIAQQKENNSPLEVEKMLMPADLEVLHQYMEENPNQLNGQGELLGDTKDTGASNCEIL